MVISLSPLEILVGLGVLVVVVLVWRSSVRRAKRIATAARESAKLATLSGRVALAGAVFGGVQWVLIAYSANTYLLVGALGIPDLLAGLVLARALTVTTVDGASGSRGRRGGGRR
ncbi:hypothetical protein [Sciscionella sediminilitoris]|uniref:hypothetical protein n=1 Tax=Sciscionella sediminilitoris TaxID=1445613 RepID=UPI0004DF0BFB|nr:hypothetical protein [Sciscionella sp. SE31]